MFKFSGLYFLAVGLTVSASANAAVINVTAENLKTAFATVKDGDVLRVTGTVGSIGLTDRNFTKAVTIDATNATFTDSMSIVRVTNLRVVGGTFGSTTDPMRITTAVRVGLSNNVTFSKSKFIGNGTGIGLLFSDSTGGGISAGNFSGFKLGLGVTSSTDVRLSSNRFTAMTSDGINIADSHRITATANTCLGNTPSAAAHPDCIQLWSFAGNAPNSDIVLSKNSVTGHSQGFTSFDPDKGGGIRISMIGNKVATSYPQGIACYACFDSIFTDNVLSTLPDAIWRTSMNIIGGGNNIIARNTIGARPVATPATLGGLMTTDSAFTAASGSTPFAGDYEAFPDYLLQALAFSPDFVSAADAGNPFSLLSARSVGSSAATVPEPMLWAELLFGFTLAGSILRRRRASGAVAA